MNWEHPLLIAFAAGLLPALVAALAYFKIRRLEINVNGKMEKLLRLTGLEAMSRGELKGAEDERARHEEADVNHP